MDPANVTAELEVRSFTDSALGADFSAMMRYINSRFTLLTYLLTYQFLR